MSAGRLAAAITSVALGCAGSLGTPAVGPEPRAVVPAAHSVEVPVNRAPARTRLQVVYAYPADSGPRPGRVDAIRATVAGVDQWYATHMDGGASPRVATGSDGLPEVLALPLDLTQEELDESEDVVYDRFLQWQAAGVFAPDALPAVYLEGEQDSDACAWQYETRRRNYITVPIANCPHYRPRLDGAFDDSGGYLLAHEIGHALGAVSPDAPHGTAGWHVRGDVRDLMYGGYREMDWANLTLDPGHDDYYLTGDDDLYNIEDSPLLEWP